MALRRVTLALMVGLVGLACGAAEAKQEGDPSILHGVAKVVGGAVFELPKTVIEATAKEAPIIGPVVGVLAGTGRAIRTVVDGVVEIVAAFDPWGIKSSD